MSWQKLAMAFSAVACSTHSSHDQDSKAALSWLMHDRTVHARSPVRKATKTISTAIGMDDWS